MMKLVLRTLFLVLCLTIFVACMSFAAAEDPDELLLEEFFEEEEGEEGEEGEEPEETEPEENEAEEESVNEAREDFINRIISLGKQLYDEAAGKAKRAHYKNDIYICKNFTVYLFRQTRDSFRMAEYPSVKLMLPNNLPAAKCKPYSYGIFWEDMSAAKGNPFEVAAQFLYDKSLTYEENLALAEEFMRNAQRGDFFQMSANYASGVGAHSAIMMGYDPETDEIHWLDSNMRGKRINGIRYAYIQYDNVKSVTWWAQAFCHKTRGATLYRLRNDIIYAPKK